MGSRHGGGRPPISLSKATSNTTALTPCCHSWSDTLITDGISSDLGAPLLGNRHGKKVQVLNLLVKRKVKRSLLFRSAGCLGFFFTTYHCEQQPLYLQKTKELTLPQRQFVVGFCIGDLNPSYYYYFFRRPSAFIERWG